MVKGTKKSWDPDPIKRSRIRHTDNHTADLGSFTVEVRTQRASCSDLSASPKIYREKCLIIRVAAILFGVEPNTAEPERLKIALLGLKISCGP